MSSISSPSPITPRRRRPSRGQVTMQDVAREAGVTAMTVSYAFSDKCKISEKTRLRVLQTARELRFEPNAHAQRLASGISSNLVALFVRHLDVGVSAEKLRFLQESLLGEDFEAPIYSGGYTSSSDSMLARMLETIRRQKPRALVCNIMEFSPAMFKELRLYLETGGALVTYDYRHELECDQVFIDRKNATYLAVRHLIELGHTRLGFFHHHLVRPSVVRFQGFERALSEAGLSIEEKWLWEADMPFEPEAAGLILAEKYLALARRERPTALVVINDYSAITCMARLSSLGVRIPQDVSFVGHDDRPGASCASPALTTISYPTREIAKQTLTLLRERLNNPELEPRKIELPSELQVRQSCASPTF